MNFSKPFLELHAAAIAGAVTLASVEWLQKGGCSIVGGFADALTQSLGIGVAIAAVLFASVFVGVAGVLYFRPLTRRGAFAFAFGLMAITLAFTPAPS